MPSKRRQAIDGQTVAELAASYGKALEVMRKHCRELRPTGKKGRANLYDPKAVESLLAGKVERSKKPEDIKELEKRKLRLQCEKLQVEIDERLGKLIPADDVRRFVATHTSAVTSHIRRQGGELSPLLEGLTVAKMEKKINAAGEELIAKLRKMPFE